MSGSVYVAVEMHSNLFITSHISKLQNAKILKNTQKYIILTCNLNYEKNWIQEIYFHQSQKNGSKLYGKWQKYRVKQLVSSLCLNIKKTVSFSMHCLSTVEKALLSLWQSLGEPQQSSFWDDVMLTILVQK